MTAITAYYGFAILRLRPAAAAASVGPYVVLELVFGVEAMRSGAFTTSHFVFFAFGLAAIFLTGLMVAIVLDVVSRQAFAQTQIIDRQRETIARERERSELLLKQELSHQVAERSRELGQMLARVDATLVAERLVPGALFDSRYQVLREVGAGGMGAVYEVERITDHQRLALKIVTGEITGAQAARFAREAEIGARIRHPHVVSIVDVGIAQGVPFLAMELAAHGTLEDQRERFGDAAWAQPILAEIAAGLAALHEAGVVHRDLKPANVLFTGDAAKPTGKISDFGISRFGALDTAPPSMPAGSTDPLAATVASTPPPKRVGGLTATGMLMGTPYYMAPEAARGGRAVDAPADVFAFGILVCELLSGTTPFPTPPVLVAMMGEPIPAPTEAVDAIPEALRALVLRCLAESPDSRPSMRELAAALAGKG